VLAFVANHLGHLILKPIFNAFSYYYYYYSTSKANEPYSVHKENICASLKGILYILHSFLSFLLELHEWCCRSLLRFPGDLNSLAHFSAWIESHINHFGMAKLGLGKI
jgi:hypothetical protein